MLIRALCTRASVTHIVYSLSLSPILSLYNIKSTQETYKLNDTGHWTVCILSSKSFCDWFIPSQKNKNIFTFRSLLGLDLFGEIPNFGQSGFNVLLSHNIFVQNLYNSASFKAVYRLTLIVLGNYVCVAVIHNYIPRKEIDYFTVPRGLETEPKLDPSLAGAVHKFAMQVNFKTCYVVNL